MIDHKAPKDILPLYKTFLDYCQTCVSSLSYPVIIEEILKLKKANSTLAEERNGELQVEIH